MSIHYGTPRRAHRFFGVSTAAPPPSATYAIDLTTGVNPTGFTYSSGTTLARYAFNSSGILTSYGRNVARFDWDPVTLSPRGLLMEGAATNYCLQSNTLATTWTNYNVNDAASSGSAYGPTNVSNAATTISYGTASSAHGCKQTISSLSGSTTYTFSAFLAWDGGIVTATSQYAYLSIGNTGATSYYTVIFDLSTGTVVNTYSSLGSAFTGGANGIDATNNATVAANLSGAGFTGTVGYYRPFITLTTASSTSSVIVSVGLAGSASPTLTSAGIPTWTAGGEYLNVWGCQLEAGSYLSSPIATTTTTVARAANAYYSTSLSWYNSSASTAICAFDCTNPALPNVQNIFSLGNTSSSGFVGISAGINPASTNNVVGQFDGVTGGNITASLGTISRNAVAKVGVVYDGSTNAACLNGGSVLSPSTIGTILTPTYLQLGSYAVGTNYFFNGHIRSFAYYNSRLTNAQLQTLTT
jgi:hypothetical protein